MLNRPIIWPLHSSYVNDFHGVCLLMNIVNELNENPLGRDVFCQINLYIHCQQPTEQGYVTALMHCCQLNEIYSFHLK